jgi:uncharacterized protein (TIGR03437 family)
MRFSFIAALLFIAPVLSPAQGTVTLVAGNGSIGFSGDGGPATSAALGLPNGLTVDGAGNLYIVDALNKRIRKVDLSGNISTYAGNGFPLLSGDGGPAANAGIAIIGTTPHQGVVVDSAGNLYLTDSGDNRIRRVDPHGIITTYVGAGGLGTSGFSGDGGPAVDAKLSIPEGLALDSAGNLYIADTGNGRIRKVDAQTGIITTVVGRGNGFDTGDGGPATEAQLANPSDVAVDNKGNIYVADFGNQEIRVVDSSGTIHALIHDLFGNCQPGSLPAAHADAGMAVAITTDAAGNLYMADASGACIHKLDAAGNVTNVGGGGTQSGNGIPATTLALATPAGVAVDAAGNVYVVDKTQGKVYKISATAAATPVVTSALNGATFGSGQPLVQGSLASIFGTALAPSPAFAPSVPLQTTLAGVSVTIGGVAAPLLFVSPAQINLQVPWNLQSQASDVIVKVNGTPSAAFSAMVGSVAPGIFTTQYGAGPAIAFNLDGTLAQPVGSIPGLTTRPAKVGDTITIFATGLGLVRPALASGAAPGSVLTSTILQPTVLIGGVSVVPSFSGLSPQFVGVNQLNVVVPDVPAGVVTLQIDQAGRVSSDKVTMAVQ